MFFIQGLHRNDRNEHILFLEISSEHPISKPSIVSSMVSRKQKHWPGLGSLRLRWIWEAKDDPEIRGSESLVKSDGRIPQMRKELGSKQEIDQYKDAFKDVV